MQGSQKRRARPAALMAGSLVGLAAGFSLGALAHGSRASWLLALASASEPVGTLWTNALRMVALPLMVSCLLLAIASTTRTRTAGRLGGLSLLAFLVFLLAAGALTVAVAPRLFADLTVDDQTRAALQSVSAAAGPETAARAVRSADFAQWVTALVPTNLLRAASEENVLGILVCVILFALAATRVAPERRETLVRFFEAVAETAKVLVGWFLLLMPLGVFALAFSMAAKTGAGVAGSLGHYVVAVCAMLFAFTALLYPVTAFAGRVSLRRFAAAVWPAQAVAVGTRSSLASLPPLVEGAGGGLGLPAEVSGLVLPLSVSAFKLNRTISAPLQLYFLTQLYGLPLRPGYVITFTLTTVLLSFTSPGIPGGGESLVTLPLYLGAGIPVEGVMLLKAVDAVPDIFKTLLNVTADMSVAAIVARFFGAEAPSESDAGYLNLPLQESAD
jgi:proton glutamate symport protein